MKEGNRPLWLQGRWQNGRWQPDPHRGVVSKTWIVTWGLLFLLWSLGTIPFFNQTPGKEAVIAFLVPFRLFTDIVLVALGVMTLRRRADWINILLYLAIAITSTIFVNKLGWVTLINGTRLYIAPLFLIPTLRYIFEKPERTAYFINKFDRSLYWLLWLQWPCMLYEFIVLGGGDRGGGSLGDFGSGLISTFIFVVSFYLMLRSWDHSKNYVANLRRNWVLLFLLLPTTLNETKISFIFLVLYLFFLIPINRKFIRTVIIVIPIICVLSAGLAWLYASNTKNGDIVFDADYLEYYTFGDDDILQMVEVFYDRGYGGEQAQDFQRGVKLSMLPAIIDDEPWAPWIGYGVSQFKGGTNLDRTDFYRRYEWLLEGTELEIMDIIVDMGLAGVVWIIYAVCTLFGWGFRASGRSLNLQWFLGILFWMLMFYYTMLTAIFLCIVFFYLAMFSWHWDRLRQYREITGTAEIPEKS